MKDFSRAKRTISTQTPSGKGGPNVPSKNTTFQPNPKGAFQSPKPPRPQSAPGPSNPQPPKPNAGKSKFSF